MKPYDKYCQITLRNKKWKTTILCFECKNIVQLKPIQDEPGYYCPNCGAGYYVEADIGRLY